MKKFFFYKKEAQRLKKTQKEELKIFVKKLIKIDFKKQIFVLNIQNKVIKKSFCLKTGRKHSVNSLYLLSRISLKELFRSRSLNGLRKISW